MWLPKSFQTNPSPKIQIVNGEIIKNSNKLVFELIISDVGTVINCFACLFSANLAILMNINVIEVIELPRTAREKSDDSIFHVMVRSISEVNLFRTDKDKTVYLNLIKKYQDLYHFKIYKFRRKAHSFWCGMDSFLRQLFVLVG